FSYQIAATNSPSSYGATGLAGTGLSIDTATGLISGTPTTSGTFSVTLSATNSGGTGSATLTLTINPPPSLSLSPDSVQAPPSGSINVTYTWTVSYLTPDPNYGIHEISSPTNPSEDFALPGTVGAAWTCSGN